MKKKFTAAIALVMALAMIFTMSACGSKEEDSAKTPEYVYTSEFAPMDYSGNGYLNIRVRTAEGSYATSYEIMDRVIPADVDASQLSEDELKRYDVYGSLIYFIDSNDNISKLPNYSSLKGPENTEGYKNFYSYADLSTMTAAANGDLITIENIYTSWYDGPEDKTDTDSDYYDYMKHNQSWYMRTLDSTGTEKSRVELNIGEDKYIYSNILFDESGNIIVASENSLLAINPQGEVAYTIDAGNYIESLVTLADGSSYASMYGDTGMVFTLIDTATKSMGASIDLPNDAYSPIPGGGDYDLYYTSGLYFYGFDIETQTKTQLFNWINCDVNGDNLASLQVLDDGTVTGIVNTYNNSDGDYTSERVRVSKVPADSVPVKEILTLACMWLDWDIRDTVIKFNRGNDKVRIEVKDYSQYNTEDDYEIGSTKYLTEMMAGDGADIMLLNGLPYSQMASRGLLEDLYPFIDGDKEISRDDIFPNVLKALEVNGKMYSTCQAFSVYTVLGAASVVGDRTSWTYDELYEALENMPEGCDIFDQYVTRDSILQTCMSLDMDSFVDWASGKCSFESDAFYQLLEFANRFPAEYVYTDDYSAEDSTENRISTGRQMLVNTSIYSVSDLGYNSTYFGGQDAVYIGYPTLSGTGNALYVESGFAMSSSCSNKEAAWEFLRTFYTEDFQKSFVYSIPSNINVYNEKIKEAMKVEYKRNDKGEYVLDENGEKVPEPRYSIGRAGGDSIDIYAMTQEEADEIYNVIVSTTKLENYDESIYNIVKEQAQAYFSGQKSVEEVARLIQSKANIYVNEQG